MKTLRGIVIHQHGCGEGSCKSGLTGAWDLHWQALARKHDCALLAPAYEQPEGADCQMWCDPRNGSADALMKGLAELSKQSRHPELTSVPWALWGHSGGGHWAGGMVMLYPDRVAAAWLRSVFRCLKQTQIAGDQSAHAARRCVESAHDVQSWDEGRMTVRDGRFAGVWQANEKFFGTIRSKGGLIGVAVDPLSSHECGNQRYMAIPWLDACLSARLPRKTASRFETCRQTTSGCRSRLDLKPLSPCFQWRPADPVVAAEQQDRGFVETIREGHCVEDSSEPPAPRNAIIQGRVLTWTAEADLESGLAGFIIEVDNKPFHQLPEKPSNPYGRPVLFRISSTATRRLNHWLKCDLSCRSPWMLHVFESLRSIPLESLRKPSELAKVVAHDGDKTFRVVACCRSERPPSADHF